MTRLTKFIGDAKEIHDITKFRQDNPEATFTEYRKVDDASDLDDTGELQLRFRYEDIRVRAWLETGGTLKKEEHRQLLENSKGPVEGIERDTEERHIRRVQFAKKSLQEQKEIIDMMMKELIREIPEELPQPSGSMEKAKQGTPSLATTLKAIGRSVLSRTFKRSQIVPTPATAPAAAPTAAAAAPA